MVFRRQRQQQMWLCRYKGRHCRRRRQETASKPPMSVSVSRNVSVSRFLKNLSKQRRRRQRQRRRRRRHQRPLVPRRTWWLRSKLELFLTRGCSIQPFIYYFTVVQDCNQTKQLLKQFIARFVPFRSLSSAMLAMVPRAKLWSRHLVNILWFFAQSVHNKFTALQAAWLSIIFSTFAAL